VPLSLWLKLLPPREAGRFIRFEKYHNFSHTLTTNLRAVICRKEGGNKDLCKELSAELRFIAKPQFNDPRPHLRLRNSKLQLRRKNVTLLSEFHYNPRESRSAVGSLRHKCVSAFLSCSQMKYVVGDPPGQHHRPVLFRGPQRQALT
jgi:hypothetical protein